MSHDAFAGQGWLQIGELAMAFALSAVIGLEREFRQKAAGLRTYTLVGFSSALIMLVSKYGFMDVLASGRVVLDPSRVAAQIVSGIGFIGGGVIFVRRDVVRGLTTAASVWLVAALGMACGAGLPILALVVTAGHFGAVFGFPSIARRLPRSRWSPMPLRISYEDGRGLLRSILLACTDHGFSIGQVAMDKRANGVVSDDATTRPIVTVVLSITGSTHVSELVAALGDIDGVKAVEAGANNLLSE